MSSVQSHLIANSASDFPEVLSFNLQWLDRNPKPTNVLQSLIAIPELFEVSELYRHNYNGPKQEYVLRGMICFGHNHYFAFFRRIFIKVGFLSGIDYSNI